MKSILPKPAEWTAQIDKYLQDALSLLTGSFKVQKSSAEFRDLYRTCLAASVALGALDHAKITPTLGALRSISLRIPLLAGAGQTSIVKVELRRFVELTLWAIYFTHHPIEWQDFTGKRGAGFSKDPRKPISFAAHRELIAYFDYAKEYMDVEPSGIALGSLSKLEADNRLLNAAVHAGEIARAPVKNPPVETPEIADTQKLVRLAKRVMGHAVVLLSAFNPESFHRLPVAPRAHFEWLVGSETKRRINAGPFGVPLK